MNALKLKEIDHFYYLIDVDFSIPMIYIKPLLVAYFERNSPFNFYKTALELENSYGFTITVHLFSKHSSQIYKLLPI